MDDATSAPPRITRSCANYLPLADVLDAEKTTPDDVHKEEIKLNDIVAEEAVVETKLDGDDEEDNDNTMSNEEDTLPPMCDWVAVNVIGRGRMSNH